MQRMPQLRGRSAGRSHILRHLSCTYLASFAALTGISLKVSIGMVNGTVISSNEYGEGLHLGSKFVECVGPWIHEQESAR